MIDLSILRTTTRDWLIFSFIDVSVRKFINDFSGFVLRLFSAEQKAIGGGEQEPYGWAARDHF